MKINFVRLYKEDHLPFNGVARVGETIAADVDITHEPGDVALYGKGLPQVKFRITVEAKIPGHGDWNWDSTVAFFDPAKTTSDVARKKVLGACLVAPGETVTCSNGYQMTSDAVGAEMELYIKVRSSRDVVFPPVPVDDDDPSVWSVVQWEIEA